MSNQETEALQHELEQFRKEKERIRALMGQIGGKHEQKRDRLLNRIFVVALLGLFVLDMLRHIFHVEMPLPPMVSIEMGVLMVSLKIIWMMHKQTKVEHFQFWILNSIEFRLSEVVKRLRELDKKVSG